MLNAFYFLHTLLFNFTIAFYLISALQWYSYKFKRILFHYPKPLWHVYFVLFPLLVFLSSLGFSWLSLVYFIVQIFILYFWNKKIDKKLVFTPKVKMFFIFVFAYNLLFSLLALQFSFLFNFITLPCAFMSLKIFEFLQKIYFCKKAQKKLEKMPDLKIILITASFGKTSIKNFLYELLKDDFHTYKTPRSVNTFLGIIKDINENLDPKTQIYIVEAGARLKGDILEITKFLNPQICIIGEIGKMHLEYFKSLENIRETKLEALNSKGLQKAFLHSSTKKEENEFINIYDTKLLRFKSSLEGLEFTMLFKQKEEIFQSQILGAFNAQNLCVAILCADFLGISAEKLKSKIAKIQAVNHRLEIISKKPKFIIDDGFNGNFKGMSQSYELCKDYKGRKILVTPGIMEAGKEENIALCKVINECFDLAIITAQINANIFEENLKIPKIILKDKSKLTEVLAKHTQNADLILFSNDAPSFL